MIMNQQRYLELSKKLNDLFYIASALENKNKGKKEYWDKKNLEVQSKVRVYRNLSLQTIRTIKDQTALAQQIKNEIENLNKNIEIHIFDFNKDNVPYSLKTIGYK